MEKSTLKSIICGLLATVVILIILLVINIEDNKKNIEQVYETAFRNGQKHQYSLDMHHHIYAVKNDRSAYDYINNYKSEPYVQETKDAIMFKLSKKLLN